MSCIGGKRAGMGGATFEGGGLSGVYSRVNPHNLRDFSNKPHQNGPPLLLRSTSSAYQYTTKNHDE